MSEQIEDIAARYILRRENRDWSERDQQELNVWLEESPRYKAIFWRLERGWEMSDRIVALNLPSTPRFSSNPLLKITGKLAVAIAASMIPVLLGWMLLFRDPVPEHLTEYVTGIGGRKVISLPDGSTVDLNTDSKIRLSFTDTQRLVYLDRGEAFFEVTHNRKRPFIVRSDDRQILDIGTKFLVRKEGRQIVAAVTEGRVKFGHIENGKIRRDQLLDAGDRVISEGQSSLVIYDDKRFVDSMASWRSGRLMFDQAALADVAAEFNRYHRRKLVISSQGLTHVRIGGSFSVSNLDGFVRLLDDAYGLTIRESGDEIIISRD